MLFYHQLKCGIRRSVSAMTLVLLLAISASAYTVVMRNGRRVEIPEKFTVTRTTLTYEVSPGMQITLQMQAINIGATMDVDLLALDEALTRLAALDPQQSRVVELRFFGGLTMDETAEVMRISAATVGREWRMAKAWLFAEISRTA